MVAEGSFREDLVYRLNIVPIELPPLCEREDDLSLLISHFLKKYAKEIGKDIQGLAPGAISILRSYSFPGNVRELENLIERAVVLTKSRLIQAEDLEVNTCIDTESDFINNRVPESAEELKWMKKKLREDAVKPLEQAFLLAALERNNWNVTKAADEVGMLRPNFQSLLKKQGISLKYRRVKA